MKRLSALLLMALMVLVFAPIAGAAKVPEMKGEWSGPYDGYSPDGQRSDGTMDMVISKQDANQPIFWGTIGPTDGSSLLLAGVINTKKEIKGTCIFMEDNQNQAFALISGTVAGTAAKPTFTGAWQGLNGFTAYFYLKRKPL